MENNKIRVYLITKEDYYDIEFTDFVNMFIKKHFFTYKVSYIEECIIKPCKIEDKDKQRVIDFFINQYIEVENSVKNATNEQRKTKQYEDNLYKILISLQFYLFNENQKIKILKMLNVDQSIFKNILIDFDLNNYKK